MEVLRSRPHDVLWLGVDAGDPTGLDRLSAARSGAAGCGRAVIESARAGEASAAIRALGTFRVLSAHRRGPHGVSTRTPRIEAWLAGEVPGFAADGAWYAGRPLMVTENDHALRLCNAAVLLPEPDSPILTRELLYTAVTRAKSKLILAGTEAAIRAAVERPIARASGLRGGPEAMLLDTASHYPLMVNHSWAIKPLKEYAGAARWPRHVKKEGSRMSDYPQMSELVAAMQGVPSTNQWDVVCSYNGSQLNAFLAAAYDAGKLVKNVQLSTTRSDPITDVNYTYAYSINFGTPALSFITGRAGFCTVTMPIEAGSSYSITAAGQSTPLKTVQVPGGTYSLQAIVPLGAVSGTDGSVSEHGNIVAVGAAQTPSAVILHFKTAGGTVYSIVPRPGPGDIDPMETYFLPVVSQYFQNEVDELDYVLATVNSHLPAAGETVLTPKTFAFTSTGEGEDGVLSLYIQTKESGNPPGNPSPSFQPGDASVIPIPAGHSASIILSNQLLQQGFLAPQLQASGFSASFNTPVNGIEAQLRTPGSLIAPDKSGNYIFGGYQYKGLNVSLQDNPMTLALVGGQMSLHWSASTSSEWGSYSSMGEAASSQYGTVNISITVNTAPIPLRLSDSDVTIGSMSLSAADFQVAKSAGSCAWYERLIGCMEWIPSYYDALPLSVPPITIALHGVDFFATTNVIAPGAQIIQIDGSAGVATPHDFLIVGQVVAAPAGSIAAQLAEALA